MRLLSQPVQRRHNVPGDAGELADYVTATTTYLDSLSEIFYVCTETGALQRWNERLTEVTGHDDETLGSMAIQDCVSDAAVERVDQALDTALETGKSQWLATLETVAGERPRLEFTAKTCNTPTGELLLTGTARLLEEDGVAVGAQDPRGRIPEAEYRRMTERISDAFYALDDDWQIRHWNEAVADRQEISASEAVGKRFWELFPEVEETIVEKQFRRAMETQNEVAFEYYYEPLDYWVQVRAFPSESGISVYSTEITERKERELALERSRDLLRNTEQLARTGGWEFSMDMETLQWTDGTYAIHDLEPDSIPPQTVEEGISFYHPDDQDEIETAVERCVADGTPYEKELRLVIDGEVRWVRTAGKAITGGGEPDCIRGVIQDITELKERELALESLHEATQGLLGAKTELEVARLVSVTAEDVLDIAGAGIYRLDDDDGSLKLIGATESYESLTEGHSSVSVGDADAGIATAYLSGDATRLSPVADSCSEAWIDGEESGVIVPIGDQGVLVAVTGDDHIDTSTKQLLETLVATTEAAFDRLESEATVRERDATLEARNRRLSRQVQINDIIRSIDQSLLQADTREAIMTAVCAQLVEADWIEFAWIGRVEPGGSSLEPQAWSGTNPTYLDTITLEDEGSTEPAWQTVTSGEPTVVETTLEEVQSESWRKQALSSGYKSVLSVPLSYDEYEYGALTVYASEPDAFGNLEQSVFEELGENIASSINTAETRQALHTDTSFEVSLQFDYPGRVLDTIARDADCTITYQSHTIEPSGQSRVLFTAEGIPIEDVKTVLEGLHAVEEYSLVTETEGEGEESPLFVATATGSLLVDGLVRHGGNPREIVATPEQTVATVDLPLEVEVREYVETLADRFGPVELDSRRTVERELRTQTGHRSDLFDSLTDRQLEVLRTAYFGGFFEWPRESTGEEIANLLDVSQPTVNRHLRLGQQTLLAELFEQ